MSAETPSSQLRPTFRRIGWVCLALIAVLFAISLPLHCTVAAAIIGGCSLLSGVVFGLALAFLTCTRRPVFIYLSLLIAILALIPLVRGYPPIYFAPIAHIHANLDTVYNYLEALRFGMFLFGFPYPFARWGHHAPDPLSEG